MAFEDLLLVAGEVSGDLHGGALLHELKALGLRHRVFGLGGDRLRREGMDTVADFSTLSVVGVGEVLRTVPKARRIFNLLLQEVDRRGARVAVLIDFPEFNLRLAKALKKRDVEVIYYVSPQVWAWRRGRLRTIGQVVDKMLVFFGFEVDFYAGTVDAVHVGHPLVDEVPTLTQAWDRVPAGELPDTFDIGLLPGSRSSEIDRLLPVLLAAAKRLSSQSPCRFVLVRAPSVAESRLKSALKEAGIEMPIVSEERFSAVAENHLALCASGTATLELGLLGTPMIVVYRVGIVSYILGRLLIRVPEISLVNLVLGERVVPELIQRSATPETIARESEALLRDRSRIDAMRLRLADLRPLLGKSGASRRAAEQVASVLSGGEAA